MARNKYTFASQAKKKGMNKCCNFYQTADNEKNMQKVNEIIAGQKVVATLENYDFPKVGDTATNLKAAADGEKYEWTSMYPNLPKPRKKVTRRRQLRTEIGGRGRKKNAI